ncbi:MAG: hypothetical protein LBL54_04980 [Clostridiales Family XIII bacterium]|jgi:hypothetical protein|nr:hypothetical protein [Clostridiales Family XIII bacterium]
MSKIKIISNPYHKETKFLSWDESACNWRDISHANNSNSDLLSEGLGAGFFPFKVKQIFDIIVKEYCAGSEVVIIARNRYEQSFISWTLLSF